MRPKHDCSACRAVGKGIAACKRCDKPEVILIKTKVKYSTTCLAGNEAARRKYIPQQHPAAAAIGKASIKQAGYS